MTSTLCIGAYLHTYRCGYVYTQNNTDINIGQPISDTLLHALEIMRCFMTNTSSFCKRELFNLKMRLTALKSSFCVSPPRAITDKMPLAIKLQKEKSHLLVRYMGTYIYVYSTFY